jgi:protocatechuate 3,4-dioxygenase beta subunit
MKTPPRRPAANDPSRPEEGRRQVLAGIGALTGAALLPGCGDDDGANQSASGSNSGTGAGSGNGGAGQGGSGSGAQPGVGGAAQGGAGSGGQPGVGGGGGGPGTCTLYPQQTEGPYYLDADLVRTDITEGRPGTHMDLEIRVLSADGCTPVSGVAVDVWQCDSFGVYSGYPGQLGGVDTTGQTFMRGTQLTDAQGYAKFVTTYPGWYPGRTTHIHFKVHPTESTEVTSQLYFPEDVTSAVYDTAPYDERGQKDTSNAQDGTAQQGSPPLMAVSETASGYLGELVVTIA